MVMVMDRGLWFLLGFICFVAVFICLGFGIYEATRHNWWSVLTWANVMYVFCICAVFCIYKEGILDKDMLLKTFIPGLTIMLIIGDAMILLLIYTTG